MLPINDVYVLASSAIGGILSFLTKSGDDKDLSITRNTLSFPILISDDIDDATATQIGKAIEVQTAYHIKSILESMVYANQVRGFRLDSATASANLKLSDDEKNVLIDLFDYINDNTLTTREFSSFSDSVESDKILNITAHTEAVSGVEILDPRNAFPTTLEVRVSTMIGTKKEELKYTLEVKCPMKKVEFGILKDIITNSISLDKDMMTSKTLLSFADMKNLFSNFGKKGKDKPKTSKLRDIVKKLSDAKVPSINLLLSDDFLDFLKEKKSVDLRQRAGYSVLFKMLPIMSLNILNPDTGIIEISDNQTRPDFSRYHIDDLEKETDAYQRELKSLIKYNQSV